jgi:hypothetical protein
MIFVTLLWSAIMNDPSMTPSPPRAAADPGTDFVYASPTGNFVFAAMRGAAFVGELPDRSDFHQIDRLLPQTLPFLDKSTDTISCVATGQITFAVPKRPAPAECYSCNGLDFRVASCGGSACASYRVEAACPHFEGASCRPGRHGESPAMEYQFSGSREFGISLIDFDPSSRGGALTLRQGRGLLHQPSAR